MRKEELRKLRALPATREMMEKGKMQEERTETYGWSQTVHKWVANKYDALFRVNNLSGIIKIAVFLPEMMKKDIKTPRYEIFLNVPGEEYITRELDDEGKEVKWLTAMLSNLDGVPYLFRWSDTKYFISKDGMDTLNRLKLENESAKPVKGAYRLQEWQQEQKDKETKRKEKREQAPWDADMKLIPKIPSGFEEWMRREACKDVFIIYKYDRKEAKEGYCSRCKKIVPVKSPRHGKETVCPACRAKAVFKSEGKIKTLATDCYYAEIIQRIKGGIVIRKYTQRQYYYNRSYDNPYISTHEDKRTLIFENGIIRRYNYESYKNKYLRWCLNKDYRPSARTYYTERKLYKRNLPNLKKTTFLKHSSVDLWETLPTSVTSYIQIEKGNPAVEMLAKMGMFRLAKDLIKERYDKTLIAQDETEISKLLKVDKARLKRLKEMDGGVDSLRWLQYEKLINTIWPDEMIKDLGDAGIKTSGFNFLPIPVSFVKSYNYLKKQAGIMNDTLYQALTTWQDYINMAEKMKMNTKLEQIAKPKDLKAEHDRLIFLNKTKGLEKQAKSLEKKWPKVNEQLPKLQKFEYELGDYCIVSPKSILDIVTEGVVLGHCVHTCDYYFSRIQTDESYLFFLRKKNNPDIPWYTLEVEPSGNIRQKRTTGDRQNADFENAVPFLKKWQQYFKEQLTKDEEKLGEKANILRKENYKKLREDGNRVWHGPLAGQLLADVLEKDFMEAG